MLNYPLYKQTNIKWLGDIPSHWDVNRLKKSVNSARNGVWGDDQKYDSNDIPCVRVADFNRKNAEVKNIDFTVRNVPKNKQEPYLLKKDDLLIEKSGGGEKQPVGFVVRYGLDTPAVYANFMAKIKLNRDFAEPKYFKYVHSSLYANRINVRSIKQTTGIQNLDTDSYFQEYVPYPSLVEQANIANFLDNKTSEIDSLIADKEKLTKLLEEKRQVIITETVTKGLNPGVKMKDSGVDWIGEIPEHWDIIKLKYLSTMKSGDTITSNSIKEADNYPVYGGGGLRGYTSSFTHEGEYVLIGRQGALCGNVKYASNKFWASEHAVVVSPNLNIDLVWLGSLIESMNLNQYSISAAQPGLSVSTIKNLNVPVPTQEEQYEISSYLKDVDVCIKEIKDITKQQIHKLKEYRQSLIYEAVTGKIDVRNYNKVTT